MVVMTKYVQYMFNMQRNTVKTVVQQRMWMTFLKQHVEGLRHKNATSRLSEAEHEWHYARQQLDAAHAMVDERTHTIIHLEHHVEQQDLDLEERAMTITTLEQQLKALQLQMPPTPTAPAAPDEPDAESNVVGQTGMCGGLTFCYFEWIG
jgi:septal ring factor EnvC (AmiA/AmiB activator)